MKKPTALFFVIISSIAFLQMGCKDESPIPPDNRTPLGKRDYTWSADTITYPGSFQTLMYNIWGSSPNDVYVVGHNDQPGPGTMFHYDGIKWSTTKFHSGEGGPITWSISLRSIYGFSKNDVWCVGERIYKDPNNSELSLDSSLIIHFNGVGWHEHRIVGRILLSIWGTDSTNVWVGGLYGTLYKYDGTSFQKQNYNSDFSISTLTGINGQNIYVRAYLQSQPIDSYVIFEKFNGLQWIRIDSTRPYPFSPNFGTSYIWPVDTNTIYTAGGGGVFKKTSTGWQNVLNTGSEALSSVQGNKGNNLFALGIGIIYHYNGEDWYRYQQFSDRGIVWLRAWMDGNEVFILGQTIIGINRTVILHGK